ncbi:Transposase for insertion sequence element IS629 [Cardinium endosymbiont cEper1 of Encarsia pergandiella]|uniref:IS3 family transposase n=2 Tax=Cardinium endosymbiont of Encarsia pergandiella TaxID=249402 RepID=UPI00027E9C23|nr:IS3 family transposase [Cardinium endosymbiont of Encarsia pergandiella]CCM10147.1 Transposase for insertion sequence element IS629 [Cardinium endosymbiont cEper1 of Encarsia pergandiella]CCM10587.1 Transposase for insertion sequence element IS629 [Cardinium endosymbiont cEper1 of Encarsia pergandiella]
MGRKKVRKFSSVEKTKIVLDLLKEELTLVELSSKYGVTSKTLQNWKHQFMEHAYLAFDPSKVVSAYKDEIAHLKDENDSLAKTLGKTTVERDWAVGKLKSLDLLSKKGLVESKLTHLPKARQCKLLSINRSFLYYKSSIEDSFNKELINKIADIYIDHPEYGYRYIYNQLLEDGLSIGKNRVLHYMRRMGLCAVYPRKKVFTSFKSSKYKAHGYLLDKYWFSSGQTRRLYVPKSNQVWSGDITYIKTNNGFIYFAAIIDWHSKAILSYKVSNSMDTTLVTDILEEALSKYPAPEYFNSDHGSQYTSHGHIQLLKKYGIKISMNGQGRSIDNVVIERFFRTIKYNCLFINDFKNIKEIKQGINDYMHKYNYNRFHSSIKYQKPMNVYLTHVKNQYAKAEITRKQNL